MLHGDPQPTLFTVVTGGLHSLLFVPRLDSVNDPTIHQFHAPDAVRHFQHAILVTILKVDGRLVDSEKTGHRLSKTGDPTLLFDVVCQQVMGTDGFNPQSRSPDQCRGQCQCKRRFEPATGANSPPGGVRPSGQNEKRRNEIAERKFPVIRKDHGRHQRNEQPAQRPSNRQAQIK